MHREGRPDISQGGFNRFPRLHARNPGTLGSSPSAASEARATNYFSSVAHAKILSGQSEILMCSMVSYNLFNGECKHSFRRDLTNEECECSYFNSPQRSPLRVSLCLTPAPQVTHYYREQKLGALLFPKGKHITIRTKTQRASKM